MHICCRFNREIYFYDICGLQEWSTVVLTKLHVLQLQLKMQFRFSQDDLLFASIFFAVFSRNYNHSGTQLFVSCLSDMFL